MAFLKLGISFKPKIVSVMDLNENEEALIKVSYVSIQIPFRNKKEMQIVTLFDGNFKF